MAWHAGRFVWYELLTTDTEAARAFYGAVVGWGAQPAPPPNDHYTMFTPPEGGMPAAGLMALPERVRAAGGRPGWIGYVGAADVDATAREAERLGGRVHLPPQDIPEVGRMAVIADPQGAVIALFRPAREEPGPATCGGPSAPGRIGWHELLATEQEAAFAFYAALFGWRKAEAVPIGPMGIYQLFATAEAGAAPVGGIFTRPPMVPVPFWQYYLTVGGIGAAAERVRSAGGQVLMGPMEVPGGGWILQGLDPQGAAFALLGTRD